MLLCLHTESVIISLLYSWRSTRHQQMFFGQSWLARVGIPLSRVLYFFLYCAFLCPPMAYPQSFPLRYPSQDPIRGMWPSHLYLPLLSIVSVVLNILLAKYPPPQSENQLVEPSLNIELRWRQDHFSARGPQKNPSLNHRSRITKSHISPSDFYLKSCSLFVHWQPSISALWSASHFMESISL